MTWTRWVERFARLPQGAADRSRCGQGRRQQRAARRAHLRGAPLPRRRRHPNSSNAHDAILALGATKVILGSALFRDGIRSTSTFAKQLADRFGPERLIAAVDGKGGKVVDPRLADVRSTSRPAEAIQRLEPFFGEFLYTHVDLEGLMRGTDMAAIAALRAATTRALTAAGGITTHEEIDELDGMSVDAVVGMALYTGKLKT